MTALLMSCHMQKHVIPSPAIVDNEPEKISPEQTSKEKAIALAQQFIITDGHVDLPYRLKVKNFKLNKEYLGIPIETDEGDFDYVRAKKGGLDAPFMSIYLPAGLQQEAGASKLLADSLITMIEDIASHHNDKFEVAHSVSDVKRIAAKGMIALPMGMENGSGIEDDLTNVDYFKKRGISYITLTHSKDNLICDSSYDTTGTHGGLSAYGEDVVREMNRRGVMIDVSHISDNTFYQVMKITKTPVIASHSSTRKFTPDFERNMSDEMIKELGLNGGVIQINFGSTFLDGSIRTEQDSLRSIFIELMEERGLSWTDDATKELRETFQKDNPITFSDVKMVANHIDHVVALAGIDHVGFGSDFDGVGDSLPTGLKDVSQFPNLIAELIDRGYSDADIEKICSKNVFRVWQAVEDYAASQSQK